MFKFQNFILVASTCCLASASAVKVRQADRDPNTTRRALLDNGVCPATCASCNNCGQQQGQMCTLWVSMWGWCGSGTEHQQGTDCNACVPGEGTNTDGGTADGGGQTGAWPTPSPDPRPACTTPADETAPPQVTFDCPIPDSPMVLYAGGSLWDSSFTWDHARDAHVDILMLSFVPEWKAFCADAPSDIGSIGVPKLHTNGCPGGTAKPPKCGQIHIGDCAGDGTATQILHAQQTGRRIILSVGGATGDANNMSRQKGRDLAHAIWQMFLGGNKPEWRGMRPLGPKVVLDGIDLDLEQNPADCVTGNMGPSCQTVMEGWAEFVVRMRAYMDADTRKRYLLTAVPINSKQTVSYPGYGSHIQGYMQVETCDPVWLGDDEAAKHRILDTMSEGYLKHADKLDFIWAQFYPNPARITMNGNCWESDLMAWAYICERGGGKCRAGVGLPMGPESAEGGLISPWDYMAKIKGALARRPLLRKRFGGTMGWDERWDWMNYGSKGLEMFSEVASNIMRTEIAPLLEGSTQPGNDSGDDSACSLHKKKRKCKKDASCYYVRALRECLPKVHLAAISCDGHRKGKSCKAAACRWKKKPNRQCINYF